MSKELTDAEIAVAMFLRFREEVRQAELRLTDAEIVQLIGTERLNAIVQQLAAIEERLAGIDMTLQACGSPLNMEFIRKKKRGQDARVRRTWLSAEKYRITWRKEVFGIAMPARYQACVLEMIPNFAGINGEWYRSWGFVAKQRLYKTLKAAQADCEKHYRLWTKAREASGIRALLELFGKLPIGIPVWVRGKLNRKAYAVLIEAGRPQGSSECEDDPSILAEASEPSLHDFPSVQDTSGPVLNATENGGDTSQSEAADGSTPTALPAKELEKAPKKPARKRTGKPSPSSKRKAVSTKNSSKRAKQPSQGSRKNKSKPSEN